MSKLQDDLIALKDILDQSITIAEEREGDYVEEDENGVVHIKRADGTPIMMMSWKTYKEMMQWGL